MPSLRIRTYRPGDEGSLAALLNAAYADLRALPRLDVEGDELPLLRAAHVNRMADDGTLWADGTLIGYVAGEPATAVVAGLVPDGTRCHIHWLGTHPAHRHQGHAAQLLARLEEVARRAGPTALQTARFVDSRYRPACRCLESRGFACHQPDHENITMVIDIDAWQPVEPRVPAGYGIRSFRAGEEQQWVDLKNRVFGNGATVEWFWDRFRGRPNFEPESWFMAQRGAQLVGMAGVITWYRDQALTEPRGAVIEWVGVAEEERRKGLGESLVMTCLNFIKPRRVAPVVLITQPFRRAAVMLYRKLGFEVAREHRTYLKDL